MNKARRQIQFSMSSLVLLLTAVCVGIGIYSTWNPSIKVLVATEPFDFRTAVTETNAKFEKWPASIVPDGAITASDGFPNGVLTTRLRKGQVIMGKDVIDPAKFPGMAIPRNHCVRNLKVPTTIPPSIRPGDRVDVFVAPSGDDENLERVCEGVRVFNVGSSTSDTGAFKIVGLLLDRRQSKAVTEAKTSGQVRLKLRDDDNLLE